MLAARTRWHWRSTPWRISLALLPVIACVGFSAAMQMRAGSGIADATATGGRTIEEVLLYSMPLGNTLRWRMGAAGSAIYLGVPAAVPGSVDLTITVAGAALGDQPVVGAPLTVGVNYVLTAFVSAANTVTVRWTQIAGAAADPDGAGGTYKVRFLQ